MGTEAVEEFISISDGQIVLEEMPQQQEGSSSKRYSVNPSLSVTRIGKRAYYKAMEVLAPQVGARGGQHMASGEGGC
jgi:F-type H+-transporting ATPase subunit alpha